MNYKEKFKKRGYNLKIFQELDSTNSYILRNYQTLHHKDVVIAKNQSAGKGRNNREWISKEEQSLSMSIVLKYNDFKSINLSDFSALTLVTGLLVLKGLFPYINENKRKNLLLKWVNDVVYSGKKLGGILVESRVFEKSAIFAVGIGINLNQNKDFFIKNNIQYGISLKNIMEKPINFNYNANDIALKIVEEFEIYYNKFIKYGFKSVLEEYSKHCVNINKKALVTYLNQKHLGTVKGIDESGALLLTLDTPVDGKKEILISAGEASIRGEKGYY